MTKNYKIREYSTQNTIQFELLNTNNRIVLKHSCAKNCTEAGRATFARKVATYKEQIMLQKTNRLLSMIESAEKEVRRIYDDFQFSDFLVKIDRVKIDI